MKNTLIMLLLATLAPAGPRATDADMQFRSIYGAEWAWRTGRAGVSASGEPQPNEGRLDDVGAASQRQRLDHWQHVLSQLDRIDVTRLSANTCSPTQINWSPWVKRVLNGR